MLFGVLILIGTFIILVVLVAIFGDNKSQNNKSVNLAEENNNLNQKQSQENITLPTQVIPTPEQQLNTESIPKLEYKIVTSNNSSRIDYRPTYYLLTTNLSLANDQFKQQIKNIIDELAKNELSKEFSAKIYTDIEVLNFDAGINKKSTAHLTEQGIAEYQKYIQEMMQKSETTLIAIYTGSINLIEAKASQNDESYTILWFGRAFKDNPVVGKYVEEEIWKPI